MPCQLAARSQSVRQTPLQWEIVALVKALNVVAIETFVTDLQPGAQRAHGRKFLDGEPDRLRCGRKAAIAQRLSGSALALSHEQLGGYAVVECRGLIFGRHIDILTRLAREHPPRSTDFWRDIKFGATPQSAFRRHSSAGLPDSVVVCGRLTLGLA